MLNKLVHSYHDSNDISIGMKLSQFILALLLTLVAGQDALFFPSKEAKEATHGPQEFELMVSEGEDISLMCLGEGNMTWDSQPEHLTAPRPTRSLGRGESSLRAKVVLQYPPRRLVLNVENANLEDSGSYVCKLNGQTVNTTHVYVADKNGHCKLLTVPEHVGQQHNLVQTLMGQPLVLPCTTVNPRIIVTLEQGDVPVSDEDMSTYDRQVGFTIKNAWHDHNGLWTCVARAAGCSERVDFTVHIKAGDDEWVSAPHIAGLRDVYSTVGEDLCLECSVNHTERASFEVFWRLPNKKRATQSHRVVVQETKHRGERQQGGDSYITTKLVLNVQGMLKDEFGNFTCEVMKDNILHGVNLVRLHKTADGDFIKFLDSENMLRIERNNTQSEVKWALNFNSKPQNATFLWKSPQGIVLNTTNRKGKHLMENRNSQVILTIKNADLEDAGVYTVQGHAGGASALLNLTLVINRPPTAKINGTQGFLLAGKSYNLQCIVEGHPPGNITWTVRDCNDIESCSSITNAAAAATPQTTFGGTLQFKAINSGKVTCRACNYLGCSEDDAVAMVSDVPEGFQLHVPSEQVTLDDRMHMACAVPKFNCTSGIIWMWQPNGTEKTIPVATEKGIIELSSRESKYSFFNNLTIYSVWQTHAGRYICHAPCNRGRDFQQIYHLQPRAAERPEFSYFDVPTKLKLKEADEVILNCEGTGSPRPVLLWRKDGEALQLNVSINGTGRQTLLPGGMILKIFPVIGADDGTYECELKNRKGKISRTFTLAVQQAKKVARQVTAAFVIPIIIVCVLLIGVVIYLARRVKREKRKVRTLTAQDVRVFLEGAADTIDPELGLDQQADLLPYNALYEFPREKLKLGRQLGCGAFGRVVKAEAEGLLFGDETTAEDGGEKPAGPTVVAVKMIKPHAEVAHLKALMTELKILIHVGKHLNVVNLLGACTTNLVKKELLVIVEYCRFGNLHSYLLRQRDDFLDQVDHLRDTLDFTIGSNNAEPGRYQNIQLDQRKVVFHEDTKTVKYEPAPQSYYATPGQDMTRSTTTDSSGAMSEHWTPKYRGDFQPTEAARVSTKDLVCWSYQVARGMEYLASRQIVHADLAARNLLLAENNVVKICDFGLARNLYKDANYLKKSDDPLPVKWMAIESIRDRVFSTQSDVWSFGVVLWEFFTLATTPFPGVPLDENFLPRLMDGYRMEKPQHSTLELYRIMKSCWEEKPAERPTFTDLVTQFGQVLDENVKQLYLELNGPYIRMNSLQQEYQNMVRASRPSMLPPVELDAMKTQPTSIENDYQMPNMQIKRASDTENSKKNPDNDNLKVGKEKPMGYINLSADISECYIPSTDEMVAESPPQGYLRMSPIPNKEKKASPTTSKEML